MYKILIVGNSVIDQVMQLSEYPQQDQEVRAIDHYTRIGGNACNTAQILAQLGHSLQFMASLGDDPSADVIHRFLNDQGIDTALCVRQSGHQTAHSSIWLNQQNGSRTITHYRNLPELLIDDLKRINPNNYDWIHFEGRNIDNLSTFFRTVYRASKHSDCILSLEIEKPRDHIEFLLHYFDVVIVSCHYLEAKAISSEQCIQQFHQINPSLKIAITLGSAGAMGCDQNESPVTLPAIAVDNIIDTIGAGDCFIAGWIDALLGKQSFNQSLQSASKLAAYKIQHRGMSIEGYQNSNL